MLIRGRVFIALGFVLAATSACSITVTRDASGSPSASSASAVVPSASAPSPSPTPALPKKPNSAARVEGKFRGSGLVTDVVTMVPRCRKGGECDVVAQSPKGGYKLDYEHGMYSADDSVHETCSSGGYSTGYDVAVQIKFHIVRAKYINDEWRATALKVVERVNSPGAKQTFTTATTIETLTCSGYHKKDRGTMTLAGNY